MWVREEWEEVLLKCGFGECALGSSMASDGVFVISMNRMRGSLFVFPFSLRLVLG